MIIHKSFTFDAAHSLPNVGPDHKCYRMHGHTYKVTLYVKGNVDESTGWVIDFADIKKVFKPILNRLDHYTLNDIEGLENPTTENLCVWIWDKLKPELPQLFRIDIQETPTSGCIYQPNPI